MIKGIQSIASKLEQMEVWKREEQLRRSRRASRWCAAASVALVGLCGYLAMVPDAPQRGLSLQTATGAMRGGTDYSEIESEIGRGDYSSALRAIDVQISDLNKEFSVDSSLPADNKEYIRSLYKMNSIQLTWLKAQALLGLHRKEEARILLREVANSDSDYARDAGRLLELIK